MQAVQSSSFVIMHLPVQIKLPGALAGAIHQELTRRNTVLLYAYLQRGVEEVVLGYIV